MKRKLGNWLPMPFDKDDEKTAIVCRVLYCEYLTNAFIKDVEHYEIQETVTAADILSTWKTVYELRAWDRFGNLLAAGRLPDGYATPKFKEFGRDRVIVSFCLSNCSSCSPFLYSPSSSSEI